MAWKRRQRGGYLRAVEMLDLLSRMRLRALLQQGTAWLAVEPATAALLDACCTGLMDGGPGTAEHVAVAVGISRGPPPQAGGGQSAAPAASAAGSRLGPAQQAPLGAGTPDAGAEASAQSQQGGAHAAEELPQGLAPQSTVPTEGVHGTGAGGPPEAAAALVAVRLSPEEVFFLHYALCCLEAFELAPSTAATACPAPAQRMSGGDEAPTQHGAAAVAQSAAPPAQEQQLGASSLWVWCSKHSGAFATSYAAYHHLRAKGWVVRGGPLYGVDYVAYQLHPAVVHSDFFVLVVPLLRGERGPLEQGPPLELEWMDAGIVQRLARQVFKRLLLLYVEVPAAAPLDSPACLEMLAVREMLVRRTVANINTLSQLQDEPIEILED